MHRPSLLALPTLALALTTAACGGGPGPSATLEAQGTPTLAVSAGDTSCTLDRATVPAGRTVLALRNTGSTVTEVYLYAAQDRIVTEKEDIAPGLDYDLTVDLAPGRYEVACMPGQTGRGLRTPLTVTGAGASPAADPETTRAVAAYRAFVQAQADKTVPLVRAFADAVRAGDVAAAKARYAPSREPWEAIEPVAESFADLDPAIDRREADLEPGETWTGWHRLEKALWQDGSVAGLGPVAARLVHDVTTVRDRVAAVPVTPASIANGAKALLDEVATRKVTGEEEAWSHTDLVDLSANVHGARTAVTALRPLLARGEPDLLPRLDAAFAEVDRVLAPYRRGTGWVSYATVGDAGRRELARATDGLGEPLSRLAAAATRP